MEAERWDAIRICRELERTYSLTKCAGYAKALRSKCKELDDLKLRSIFDMVVSSRNVKACNAMMPIMDERGLAYKEMMMAKL